MDGDNVGPVERHDTRQCLAIGLGPSGRGLFVRRDVKAGETLLVLPSRALLHVKSAAAAGLLPHDVLPSSQTPSNGAHWHRIDEKSDDDVGINGRCDDEVAEESLSDQTAAAAPAAAGPSRSLCPSPLPLTSVQCLTVILARWRAQARKANGEDVSGAKFIDEQLDMLLRSYPASYPGMPIAWRLFAEHATNMDDGTMRASIEANKGLAKVLLDSLPYHVAKASRRVERRFWRDANTIKALCSSREDVLRRTPQSTSVDILLDDLQWAWCSVNSRCVFLSLGLQPHGDNFTLAPLLDMANHTMSAAREAKVRTLPARSLELKAPAALGEHGSGGLRSGEEVFISYGPHSNATLLTEYGFCLANLDPSHADWKGNPFAEVNVDHLIKALLGAQGPVGQKKKQLLTEEGYWGDYSIHPHPAPAYPSHRLVVALRLAVLDLTLDAAGQGEENGVEMWRACVRGMRESISPANEDAVRALLAGDDICGCLIADAQRKLAALQTAKEAFHWQPAPAQRVAAQQPRLGMRTEDFADALDMVASLLHEQESIAIRLRACIEQGHADW